MTPTLPAYLHAWRPVATIERPQGAFRFYRPAPGVVVTHIWGNVEEDAGHCFALNASAAVAGGVRHRFLHDWEQLTGYEPRARQVLMRWAFANRPSVIDVHALVRSKLLAMGWAASALALGQVGMPLRVCATRGAFEKLLAEMVRGSRSASASL
jgi:hypothetical protein